jgi:hypothetical protein
MKVMVLLLLLGETMLVLLCQARNGKWGLERKRWKLKWGYNILGFMRKKKERVIVGERNLISSFKKCLSWKSYYSNV